MTAPKQEDDEGLWVRSDVMPDGTYVVTVSFDADHVWVLDRAGALRYAVACVAAAQRAEYDAAVFRLTTERLDLDHRTGAAALLSLRLDRPPPDDDATRPLTFAPGVTARGKPFLTILLDGEPAGQLDPPALRSHAMNVLEAPAAADLDAGFLRFLLSSGLDEPTARAAVGDIANWRTTGVGKG